MTRWDAARWKQQQAPRRYRPCGPVGKWQSTASHFSDNVERRHLGGREFGTCVWCGYHVCSCPPKRAFVGMDLGYGEASRTIVYETAVGKLTVVVAVEDVGPPRFVQPPPKLPPDDGLYRCSKCRRGETCIYGAMSMRTCQQVIDGLLPRYDANGGEPEEGP